MEADPTTKSAVKHYLDGKGVVLTQSQGNVWLDAFRGYDPWMLLEAARSALKFERGAPEIEKLQKHYTKAKKGQKQGGTRRESYFPLDMTREQSAELRRRLAGVENPEPVAFEYAREIGIVHQVECDR